MVASGAALYDWLKTSTWSPPESLAWRRGISVGLWVHLEEAWALG